MVVLLLTDPLETDPPLRQLPFAAGDRRIELDLASPAQREAWQGEFQAPLERALDRLPSRGVQVRTLSTDAASDAWLVALGRAQSQVA